MPYAKDWRKYEPMLEYIVLAFEKGFGAPMEATYDTAQQAHSFRLKFYAYVKALEKAKKEEKAKTLWDIARAMTFRVEGINGEKINFVKGYTGKAKLTICQAGFDKFGDSISEFARQNGILSSEEELMDTSRPSYQALIKAQEDRDRIPNPLPPPPLVDMEIKRQGKSQIAEQPIIPLPSPPLEAGQPSRHDYSAEEIKQALDNPFTESLFDSVAKKDVEAAFRLAKRQMIVFEEGAWYTQAAQWLGKEKNNAL